MYTQFAVITVQKSAAHPDGLFWVSDLSFFSVLRSSPSLFGFIVIFQKLILVGIPLSLLQLRMCVFEQLLSPSLNCAPSVFCVSSHHRT